MTPPSLAMFPWLGRIEVGDITPANIRIVETSCFLGIEFDLLCQEKDVAADREWMDDNNVRDDAITAGVTSFADPNLPGAMSGQAFDDDQQARGT